MTEDTALLEKREELKCQLAAGAYNPYLMRWVDKTGHLIQRLLRNPKPPSYWFTAIVLSFIPLLMSIITLLLLGEFQILTRLDPFGLAVAIGVTFLALARHKLVFAVIFATQREHLLDTVTSMKDLVDLWQWLKSLNSSKALFFGLAYGILITGITIEPVIGFGSSGEIISFIIFSMIGWTLGGMAFYHLFQIWAWFGRFDRFQFTLYESNPSSSEVIVRISGMLQKLLYIFATFGVVYTLTTFTSSEPASISWIISQIIIIWAPLIATFVIGHNSLSKIITNAKWQKLNHIQARVKRLETEENIEDKETMETVKRLVEYHNQILSTPNSALNIRASLNFLNSLLLPVIAFVLANLDKVLELF